MDDPPLDIRKDNDPKSTETEHPPPENSPEVEKNVNRLNPNAMAVSPEENISRTGGNSDWAFEQRNKKSVNQANKEKEVVRSTEIRTERKGKKKRESRIVFEPNLGAKRQRTLESSFNTDSNNNRNRLSVGDCSETTTQELISSIPSTSAGPSLSSKCPISENIPTNINRQSRFMCKFSDKPFKNRKNLNAHSITHSTKRPFSCKDCKKIFKRKDDFNKHKRLHTGERPFVCSICQKTFNVSSNLLRHTRIHTGDKPYVCRTCGKDFSHNSSKKKHEKICKGLLKSHEMN